MTAGKPGKLRFAKKRGLSKKVKKEEPIKVEEDMPKSNTEDSSIVHLVSEDESEPEDVKPEVSDEEDDDEEKEDEPVPVKKERWTNRHRVLVFSSRGIVFRMRHLMNDMRTMLPHSKSETKMEKKENLEAISEICEMRNCQVCVYFEMKKHQDAYMWISATPNGPSAKFHLENVHTLKELRMTGNCLKGSRPIISYGREFESAPHWRIIRELFTQVFNTPNHHPKSQPFIDHVISFSVVDSRVWFRNYQIVDEEKAALTEIGPRFTANPIAVFAGSFRGALLWRNPDYVPPSVFRRALTRKSGGKYLHRMQTKMARKERLENPPESYAELDPTNELLTSRYVAQK